jgi:DNA-binding transcriptional ArsR family regulator
MDVFEAIAEPNRRRILGLLIRSELPAGDLVSAIGLSQPGVSKHLKCLREAGLVSVRADGQKRVYRIAPDRLAELDAWLEPYRRFWRARLDELDRDLRTMERGDGEQKDHG